MRIRSGAAIAAFAIVGCGSASNAPSNPPKTEPARAAMDVSDSGQMHVFNDPWSRCSISFPRTPVRLPLPAEVETAPDSPHQMASWEARVGETYYILTVSCDPPEFLDANFDLERLADGGNNPHWRLVSRRSVITDGQPGKLVEYVATDGMRSSVSAFCRYKGTVVTMSVNGPVGLSYENKDAKAFIESFRFVR